MPSIKETLYTIWPKVREKYRNRLIDRDDYSNNLYYLQMDTNFLFDYAYCGRDKPENSEILEELLELYLLPLQHLEECNDYWFFGNDWGNDYGGSYCCLSASRPPCG